MVFSQSYIKNNCFDISAVASYACLPVTPSLANSIAVDLAIESISPVNCLVNPISFLKSIADLSNSLKILKNNNIAIRKQKIKLTTELKNQIVELYACKSIKQICKLLNVPPNQVSLALKENNIVFKQPWNSG
jgi:hypothetical protein